MAVNLKKYDFPQVLKSVFDDDANTLRVSVVAGGGGGGDVEVSVNHTDDSIRLGDGTTLFTGTTVGPKTGLDVNVINNPINVVVSNEVEVTNDAGNPLPVNGTVTANLGTLNGAATSANQTTTNTTLSSLLTELQQKTEPTDTQPISAASLPLPAGASTSALQTSGNASLSSIDTKLTSPLTVIGPLTDSQLRASVVPVSLISTTISNFPANQNVSVTTSVLPTGASTSVNQITANASLSSIDTKLTSPLTIQSTNLDVRDLVFATDKIDASGSSVSISNLPAVQPVSDNGSSLTVDGTVELGVTSLAALENITATVSGAIDLSATTLAALENVSIDNFPANQNVTVTSSALPTGAATSANQTTANSSLSSIDSKLTSPLTVQSVNLDIRDLTFAADKVDASGSSVSVTNFPATQTVSGTVELGGTTLSALESITVQNGSGASAVNIQDGGNSITVDGTVNVGNFPATQNVNVTNSSIAVTGPLTDTQLRASSVPVTGTVTANLGTIAGVATETTLSSLNTKVPSNLTVTATRLLTDGSGVTQPVSASSLPLPTGASTSANQTTANTTLSSIDSKLTSPLTITGALTDTQLRASVVPVSLTSTTITSSALPNGASTSALQTSGNSSLSSIDTKTPALGQALAAASVPVVLTSAQLTTLTPLSTVAVTGPLTDTQLRATSVPISGTVTANLGTIAGVATETTLSTINSKITTSTTIPSFSSSGIIVRNIPFEPHTYSASASFVAASLPTAVFNIIGSASKVIRITKIRLTGTTTSGSPISTNLALVKRTTLNTGGTRVVATNVSHDNLNPVSTADVGHYTSNPTTLGTSAGDIRRHRVSFNVGGVTGGDVCFEFTQAQPVILRGTSEQLGINLGGITITGSQISVSIEWREI